jgi:chromosome segregation ATPase
MTEEEKMDDDEIDDGSPDRVEALAENLVDLRRQFNQAQAKHTQSLDMLNGKFNQARAENKVRLHTLDAEVRFFRQETSRSLNWLLAHFTSDDGLLVGLSLEMNDLRDNVTVIEVKVDKLEGKVEELQADVRELQADVRELQADVRELKTDMVDVKGSLKEILERLPPAAA